MPSRNGTPPSRPLMFHAGAKDVPNKGGPATAQPSDALPPEPALRANLNRSRQQKPSLISKA